MNEVNSTFKTTINEFCDAANWLTSQLYNSKNSTEKELSPLTNKIDVLCPIAERYERTFRTSEVLLDEELILKLENSASSLWNSSTIAIRTENNDEKKLLFCHCKFFATILFSVHDALIPLSTKNSDNRSSNNLQSLLNGYKTKVRTFKCLINTLKCIMDHQWIQLIEKIQDQGDKYLRVLTAESDNPSIKGDLEVAKDLEKLKFEFFLLNFQLALKDGNLETAKIYESKFNNQEVIEHLDAETVMELSRIIYNATISLNDHMNVNKNKEESSNDCKNEIIYFLKLAHSYLEMPLPALKLQTDYNNLKFSILLFLANILIEVNEENLNYVSESEKYLEMLQNEFPRKIESFLLAIQLQKKKPGPSNSEQIEEIIMRMIMSVSIITNFDAVVGSIKDFCSRSSRLGILCLDYIVMNKIDVKTEQNWLEKLILLRFFLTTQSNTLNSQEIIESLEPFCNALERILVNNLSKPTLSSIITLLWNSGKKQEKQENYELAIKFYRLSLRNFLSHGYSDKGKIQRALQGAYINIEDFAIVEQIYEEMEIAEKEFPLTQLLILKVYLKRDNIESAFQCLKKIQISDHENSMDALILGVSECKRSTDLAIRAISLIFEKLNNKEFTEKQYSTWSVPTLSLLRYTLQMILKLSEENGVAKFQTYLDTMYGLIWRAYEYLQKIRLKNQLRLNFDTSSTDSVSIDEVEWFSSIAYNVTSKCLNEDNINYDLIPFARLSCDLIDLVPLHEFTFPKMFHYRYWQFRCKILTLVVMKNKIKGSNIKELKEVELKVTELTQDIVKEKSNPNYKDASTKEDEKKITECLLDSLQLSYEIALCTRDRQKILEIVNKAQSINNSEIDTALFNITLDRKDLPKGMFLEVIYVILKRNIGNTIVDDLTLCSWLNIYLETCLNNEHIIAIDLVENIFVVIKTNVRMTNGNDEQIMQVLEGVATLCWNQGVNMMIKEDKKNGVAWCRTSIKWASLINRGLQEKFQDLWLSLTTATDLSPDLIAEEPNN
ncbi:Spo22p NDAI_0A02370 [Naumovozyma dairenensis CBS 421]|uniref:Protein ZIP4 homolog n=1 Tax=Naumovozyma dairenensis (strain ATCC 10597 / BCRC 20456 / CBS 421 / NBRC 0211 / NRRL Y-12639) TaxID=1071378 RepID=G0W3K7_NAUDC|nr:hypothetical protein NDAI_0A02370 [Naumovozyma dairenensis CBS 421]CCD22395.1 hypothetical protein NDAI_0A02370 [Naumovozyma dairenensis CBS 421]